MQGLKEPFLETSSIKKLFRNKTLAPFFKKPGIIEQWGNGLKLIAEELQHYTEIGFDWIEPEIAFRVAFTNKNLK